MFDLRKRFIVHFLATTADLKSKTIPSSFPGKILIEDRGEEHTPETRFKLHKDYRGENVPSEEFMYFVKRILSAVRPSFTKFKTHKHEKKLSEIFTPSDEAFALVMLLNEYNCWMNPDRTNTKNGKKKRKKFTDPSSGKKMGYSLEGRKLYAVLVREITKRRATEASQALEELVLQEFEREHSGEAHGERESNNARRMKRQKLAADEKKFNIDDFIDTNCDFMNHIASV